MPDDQKIVVHFQDRKILKGYSQDFFPNKDRFHLNLMDHSPAGAPLEVLLSQLKAVFFVKDYGGNKDYHEIKEFINNSKSSYGKKTVVTFKDGETLFGFTQSYTPNRIGFFLFPFDTHCNNLKVFVIQSFVTKVDFPA